MSIRYHPEIEEMFRRNHSAKEVMRKDLGKRCRFWDDEPKEFVIGILTYADDEAYGVVIVQCDGCYWYKHYEVIE